MSIADLVSRRLSRLSRLPENESGQKDTKNLLAVPTVPSVPTDITESRAPRKISSVDILPVVAIPANRDADTLFPVGTLGTVGTPENINGKFCPDLRKPESGQSGQNATAATVAAWLPRGYGRCRHCGEFGWLPEGPVDIPCERCAALLADEGEVTLRGELP